MDGGHSRYNTIKVREGLAAWTGAIAGTYILTVMCWFEVLAAWTGDIAVTYIYSDFISICTFYIQHITFYRC